MKKIPVLSVIIFIFLMSVFAYISYFVKSNIKKDFYEKEDSLFELEANQLTNSAEQLFVEYSQFLISVRGLFNSSDVVEREEWYKFINSMETSQHFPNISRLAYVKRLKEEDKNNYINSFKKDTFFSEDGFPDFSVFPESSNQDHYVIHYAYPIEGSHDLYGFDLTTQNDRLTALELARDTNTVVMTKPITLIKGDQNQKSFLMLLPVYSKESSIETLDQRRENIEGFILLGLESSNFIEEILSKSSLRHITSLKIDDVSKDVESFLPLTMTKDDFSDSYIYKKVTRRTFASRTWELVFYSDYSYMLSNVYEYFPFFILIIGFLVSFMVSYSLFNFSNLRYQAEKMSEKLVKDLRKYQLAVQNISEQIVIADADGKVLFANPAAERITGYYIEEILGSKVGKLWGGLMPEEFYKEMWNIVKVKKQTYIGELKNKRKNGETYISEIRISPIKKQNGEVEFFVVSERDLSNEKKIDKIKNQFIALASHQLRTPLSSMKWNMEMLIKGDVGKLLPEQSDLTKSIYESVQRMITLVNSLLNVSRIESGKLMIDPKPTNIISLVTEVLAEFKNAASKKKIKIETNFASDISEINVDRVLIKEVYRNLLTNALKYSKVGGLIKLNIKKMGNNITSELIDNGIGIPVKDQNSIFNKFHRGSNVLKADTDGNGLGLYMTKIIVETSNGKIWFDSNEDKGTTFWFTLPIEQYITKKGTQFIDESDPNIELHNKSLN